VALGISIGGVEMLAYILIVASTVSLGGASVPHLVEIEWRVEID